jgi:hypothetical protein
MFRADYVFTPGPPETADSLSVWVAGDDSVEARVRLSPDLTARRERDVALAKR